MPNYSQTMPVDAPPVEVWAFVSDVDNWAELFPGYQRHVQKDADSFSWKIRGESGVWSRLVEFDVEVQSWEPPNRVVFQLEGRTESVEGTGTFSIDEDGQGSIIAFDLSANGKGPMAPMLNGLLARFLDEQAEVFLRTLAQQIPNRSGTAESAPAEPETFPAGPGVIVVHYQAPRNAEFEAWMHGPHYSDLLSQPGVSGVTRFERIGTAGSLHTYLALIHSEDLATTLHYRTTHGAAEMAEADRRGVVRGESFLARVVYDRRIGPFRRLLRRLRAG